MPTFRARSITITAQRWFPPGDERHDPLMLKTSKQGDHRQVGDLYLLHPGGAPGIGGSDVYMVRTPSGDARVNPGDWIIRGPRTDIVDRYPCDDATFRAKYEEV